MLIQFRFKNFKSFRDDTILDLTATKTTEYADHIIRFGDEKLLPLAAIYGANASGKSNVVEAFRFMAAYVADSFAYGGENDDKSQNNIILKTTPFLFDQCSQNKESSFEVYFIVKGPRGYKTYNYGFSLDQNGVVEEWLNSKAKTSKKSRRIFYRSRDELDLTGLPAKSRENIQIALEQEVLVSSLGAKLKIEKLKMIRDWFNDTRIIDFANPITDIVTSKIAPIGFENDMAVREKVARFIAAFDASIVGFSVQMRNNDEKKIKQFRVNTIHKMIDSNETTEIPLRDESAGTLKMFALYPLLQNVLESGGILLIDELDARLHPLLVRCFLIAFLDPETNPKHAQIIFTTHDAWQLSNGVLRRDEIWFTDKDLQGVSSLYSLADFVDEDGSKIRKDENYEKNYLLGKYAAIPTLRAFDMFVGGNNVESR